ncbi:MULTISPECIES: glycerol-3-phosphate dehydrogenase/oxidase [unclassified Oceanobacter]|uniref:glycerol-3-phosphate dehydrogenase/oxidase n=1 Tax=unclassified Oceanobacter TaxID=2620260 RepID=UPI0026E3B1B0|nr:MULTISPECIES: glycerol-3-phosphate dehydrogenase/oxidase [unclassified Oceanobacter]MDO6681384.1 glycerol-3-phosphate dehydrogenase/oxidase [Oceanobacter sp. 5_MG-2023]MDP2548217.1 glycerol-3-phosphate dehydrogenase/oxidase [Oceanobacter sp. 4_MG-2023]
MTLRQDTLKQLDGECFDVLIVGGGINGAVSAAALASHGARVALIDAHDVGSATSANSSNLVWGGIKYLESGEVALVNELCRSRNRLMQRFPSRIREIRFLTTVPKGFRKPAWMVYLGALLYWGFGRGVTLKPEYLSRRRLQQRQPLINTDIAQGGLEYSDAWLVDNDARLTFDFIRTAVRQGAVVANYTASAGSQKVGDEWHTWAVDQYRGEKTRVRSRVLLNATGPWVDDYNQHSQQSMNHHHVYSKGIHLIVPRLVEEDRVLAFFASDGRLFFMIPMGNKTCLGTTDTRVKRPEAVVTDSDRQFVLDNVNQRLNLPQPLTIADVISERCGVRPLVVVGPAPDSPESQQDDRGDNDWLNLSRKHAIDHSADPSYLSIFGGKLTDCINVGEEIHERLCALGISLQPLSDRWFGEPDERRREGFWHQATAQGLDQHWCEHGRETLPQRWWRRYGTDAFELLVDVADHPEWLQPMLDGDDVREAEVRLAARLEMVTRLEDFLRRRTMLELTLGKAALAQSPALARISQLLFGSDGERQLENYLATTTAATNDR